LLHADPQVAERLGGIVHKGQAARGTLVTLIPLAVFAVLVAGFVLAAYDDHGSPVFFWASAYNRGIRNDWRKLVVLAPASVISTDWGFLLALVLGH
jgi:hypothetical protein